MCRVPVIVVVSNICHNDTIGCDGAIAEINNNKLRFGNLDYDLWNIIVLCIIEYCSQWRKLSLSHPGGQIDTDCPLSPRPHVSNNITTEQIKLLQYLIQTFWYKKIECESEDVKHTTTEIFIEIDSAAYTKIIDTNIDRIRIWWSHSKQLYENVRLRKWDVQNWRTRCKSAASVDSCRANGLHHRITGSVTAS